MAFGGFRTLRGGNDAGSIVREKGFERLDPLLSWINYVLLKLFALPRDTSYDLS